MKRCPYTEICERLPIEDVEHWNYFCNDDYTKCSTYDVLEKEKKQLKLDFSEEFTY